MTGSALDRTDPPGQVPSDGESSIVLDWTVHPFRERRRRGFFVLAFIAVFSIAAVLWGRSFFWGIFSFAVLFFSLESFFFPTRFLLEEGKLTVIRRFSKSEREWTVFKRCTLDPEGITLSPFRRASWLEAYRAIRLRFGPANREGVVRFVRERLGSGVLWVSDRRWKSTEGTA